MRDDNRANTSSTLMARLRDPQDQEAWSEFLRTYSRLIQWGCLRCGLDMHEAEDASQEVLLAVRNGMVKGTYDRAKKFRPWLHGVTVNVARKMNRKRRPIAGIEGFGEGLSGRLVGGRLVEGDDPTIPQPEWDRAYLSCLLERALERIRTEFPEKTVWAFEETALSREKGEDDRNYLSVSELPLPGSIDRVVSNFGWTRQRVYKARNLIGHRIDEILHELADEDRWA